MTPAEKIIQGILNESIQEEKTKERFNFQQLHEIMERDFGPIAWIVEGLFPMESISILSGDPGNFKTWITMDLARSIAQGVSFLGKFETIQGAVLFIDEENSERVVQARYKKMDIIQDEELPIYYLNRIGFKIDDKEDLNNVIDFVKEKDIKLVIIDSLVRIHSGDENTSQTMSKVMRCFQEIVKAGASVISTHHHRKGPAGSNPSLALRGSSDILAGVDCHIIITHAKEENRLYFKQPKLRTDEPVDDFSVSIIKNTKNGGLSFLYEGENKMGFEKSQEVMNEVLSVIQISDESITFKDLKTKLSDSFSDNALREALKNLTNEGIIIYKAKGRGERFYSLVVNEALAEVHCG